jgi:hypothetical protein
MIRIWWSCLLILGLASSAGAQALPPDVVDILKSIKTVGDKAATLIPPDAPPPLPYDLAPKDTAALQKTVNLAPPGSTITVTPMTTYRSVTIPATQHGLIIKPAGWTFPNAIGAVPVSATNHPPMAIIKGDDRGGFGLWILGSDITVQGIAFMATDPIGAGEMLRLGDATDPNLAHVPHGIKVLQSLFLGSTVGETATGTSTYGQKRAIALNSADTLVDQIRCQDIFVAGQDSQCIAIFSTPGNIIVRRSVLSSGAEPFLVGGTPPAGPAFLPDNILVEYCVLYHPLKYRGRSPSAVVKNLFELKAATHVTFRKSLVFDHWQAEQPGYAIVLTMATNGACPYCRMGPVLVEDVVVYNVAAGFNITGYQYTYAPGAGQFEGLTIRNVLAYTDSTKWGGNGRPVALGNEPKNVSIDRSTFVHNGNSFLNADYGTKWPFQDPPLTGSIKAGPLVGMSVTNSILYHGSLGIFTPDGSQGVNVAMYFPGLILGGNAIVGAPSAALARYNAFAGAFGLNTNPSVATMEAGFENRAGAATDPSGLCMATGSSSTVGVDCTRLQDVFPMRAWVPDEIAP